jgi:anti-sigma regulatory factor (Ser/Thr protein kinase)
MELASAVASISESYPARPESIRQARIALTTFAAEAGATEEQQEQVRLVVSEAVTNAVQHAYGGRPGEIHLTGVVVSGELWILVADDGGGLGLVWMAQFSDGMTLLARSSGGVEVRLRFDLRHAGALGAHESAARVARVC